MNDVIALARARAGERLQAELERRLAVAGVSNRLFQRGPRARTGAEPPSGLAQVWADPQHWAEPLQLAQPFLVAAGAHRTAIAALADEAALDAYDVTENWP